MMTTEFNTPEGKTWIKGILNDENITDLRITFTKADGTPRTMLCTTAQSRIPPEYAPKGSDRSSSDDTQRVFDIETQGWRSFRWDRLTHVEFNIR